MRVVQLYGIMLQTKQKTFDALPIVTPNIWHKGFVSVIAWQVSWQSKSPPTRNSHPFH